MLVNIMQESCRWCKNVRKIYGFRFKKSIDQKKNGIFFHRKRTWPDRRNSNALQGNVSRRETSFVSLRACLYERRDGTFAKISASVYFYNIFRIPFVWMPDVFHPVPTWRISLWATGTPRLFAIKILHPCESLFALFFLKLLVDCPTSFKFWILAQIYILVLEIFNTIIVFISYEKSYKIAQMIYWVVYIQLRVVIPTPLSKKRIPSAPCNEWKKGGISSGIIFK